LESYLTQQYVNSCGLKIQILALPKWPVALSTQFGTNDSAAYGWIYSYLHPVSGAATRPAVTLDAIALKKKFYEDQLKALAKEEQKLIDAKALKLIPCYDGKGVLIKKEGNQMALLLEDAQELVEKLTDFLTQP
jgi:hypothetical protein